MTRSNAREIVAHLIFEMNFKADTADEIIDVTMEPDYYSSLGQETEIYAQRPNTKQMEYIRQTAAGIKEKQAELDAYISKYSVNWSVSRISKVSRAIMHVAMYEALYVDDVPVSAAINEAVDIASRYSNPDSGGTDPKI